MSDDDVPPGAPEWVVTYGDMMSLLLTFFIMLVSMSELKGEGKLRAMMDAIREAFGASDGLYGAPGESYQTRGSLPELSSRGRSSEGGTKRSGRKSDGLAGPHQPVRRLSHGTIVTLGGPALFERFDASLPEGLREDLDVIVRTVKDEPNRIIVRGHASREPLPPGLPFRDQLDLSFARARNVAEYLVTRGIDRDRLAVCAAGDTEPRTSTRDRESQKQNCRVDVFLVDAYLPSNDGQ